MASLRFFFMNLQRASRRVHSVHSISFSEYHRSVKYCQCKSLAAVKPYHKRLLSIDFFPDPVVQHSIKYCSSSPENHTKSKVQTAETTESTNLTIFQRFKQAYKEHGKVLVGVHVATSIVWYGSFFYIASSGVDVVGILGRLGVSDWLLDPLRDSSLGHAAVAYLMYKLATPARYTVTLGATSVAIRHLKRQGHIQQPDVKVRELMREGADKVKDKVGDRVDKVKDRLEDRVEDVRERVGERYDEAKEKFGERRQQLSEKYDERKSKLKKIKPGNS